MDYSELVKYYVRLEGTTLKTEKTAIVAELLASTPKDDMTAIVRLVSGKVFPDWSEEVVGVASNLMIKAIALSCGAREDAVVDMWKKKGDLGVVAGEFSGKKSQAVLFKKKLTVTKVLSNIEKIAGLEGAKSQKRKLELISELLGLAEKDEAKFIVRTVLADLRIGVAEGTIRDAIASAFFADVYWRATLVQKGKGGKRFEGMLSLMKGKTVIAEDKIIDYLKSADGEVIDAFLSNNKVIVKNIDEILEIESFFLGKLGADYVFVDDMDKGNALKERTVGAVEEAYEVTNDFGAVAVTAMESGEAGLSKMNVEVMRPLKVMLAQKAASVDDAFSMVGRPAALEYKYDGFRMQIHKKGDDIAIFTRRLENVTKQFPDVVEYVHEAVKCDDCIIEGETIGIDVKTGRSIAFQNISKRIKRKYDIREMADEVPVVVNLFDVIFANGKTVIKEAFSERRKMLEAIVKEIPGKIVIARQLVTSDSTEANDFYQESLAHGNEGIMFKGLESPYKPGSRVGHMIKLKPVMETLDLVIVGAEWGTGKRSGWLSSFTLACRDEDTGEFLTIGKMGTGFKEKAGTAETADSEVGTSFDEMTEKLKEHILREKGKEVEIAPFFVVEVAYEEIQKSTTYSSGYALRFPRIVRAREDRSPDESDTISRIDSMFKAQRGRQ